MREWAKQDGWDAGTDQDGGLSSSERQDLAELRRENRRLREDVEILAPPAAIISAACSCLAMAAQVVQEAPGGGNGTGGAASASAAARAAVPFTPGMPATRWHYMPEFGALLDALAKAAQTLPEARSRFLCGDLPPGGRLMVRSRHSRR